MDHIKYRVFLATFLLMLGCVTSYRINHENIEEDGGGCARAVKRSNSIEKATLVLDSSSAIYGKWVSEGCETRPGPEFLLRSYTFHPNGTFKLIQFYYGEESCSSPRYTVVARGELRSKGLYSLNTVSIIPHDSEVAYHLSAKVNLTCQGLVRKRWKSYKEYYLLNLSGEQLPRTQRPFTPSSDEFRGHHSIHRKHLKSHYPERFNCLHALNLVFHELHHFKVQIRPSVNDKFKTTYYRQELLLGDTHSKIGSRANYNPTAFQVPLLRVDASVSETLGLGRDVLLKSDSFLNFDTKGIVETRGPMYEKSYIGHFDMGAIGDLDSILSSKNDDRTEDNMKDNELFNHCPVCSSVAMAHERSPPHLLTKLKLPLALSGEWVSTQCEQRPMNLFLTRHFKFYTGDETWIVEYKFFYDTACSGQSFSMTAAGHYKIGKPNHFTPGGTDVDFHVEKASLTVFDPTTLENLRNDNDCGVGEWKLGYPRELSSTHGCPTLGFVVPSIEFELLRMEADFYGSPVLFMGMPDTDNSKRSAKDRPTAYQLPLMKCENLPEHSESLKEILSSPLYGGDEFYTNYGGSIFDMDSNFADSGSCRLTSSLVLLIVVYFFIR